MLIMNSTITKSDRIRGFESGWMQLAVTVVRNKNCEKGVFFILLSCKSIAFTDIYMSLMDSQRE